ncbi:MAG: hypothetical protein WCL10_19195 [Novosphingobium sp.]|jgi:hypothetical protein|uniref:hypothetical protein n=1 Tax=Novosphingobium sp. TaxID=1874826 RepID=UPI00301B2989
MDDEAEAAIKRAFEKGEPYNSTTIPDRAREELNDRVQGPERISAEIERMVNRGELQAPCEPWKDWVLL